MNKSILIGVVWLLLFGTVGAHLVQDGFAVKASSFRTEGAFYYSFYKRIVDARSFNGGLQELATDVRVSYPQVINSLATYPISFEIGLAALYHTFAKRLSQSPLLFYVMGYIVLATLGYIVVVKESLSLPPRLQLIPLLYVLCTVYVNSRLGWIGFRENLGISWLSAMVLATISVLSYQKGYGLILLTTILFLLSWDFSPYYLLGIVLSLFVLSISDFKQTPVVRRILAYMGAGYILSFVFSFFNPYTVYSFTFILIVVFLVSTVFTRKDTWVQYCVVILITSTIKIALLTSPFLHQVDGVLVDYLHFLFMHKDSLAATLYTQCSGTNFIPLHDLVSRLIAASHLLILMCYKKWKPTFSQRTEGKFLIVLTLFTLILSIFVQRFTVIYMVIVAILVIRTLFFERGKYVLELGILASAVVLMSLRLTPNSVTNQSLRNEAANTAEWLGKHAEIKATIGGSTLVTSMVLAHYSFPVINTTFYESTNSQRATADILRVYAHSSAYDYWSLMRRSYRLDYLVLERGLCNSTMCNLHRFFKNTNEHKLCEELVLKSTPYFDLRYYNHEFAVLKLLPGASVTSTRSASSK